MTQALLSFIQQYITLWHVTNWKPSSQQVFLGWYTFSFCGTVTPWLCNMSTLEGLRSSVRPQLSLEWADAQGCKKIYLFSCPPQYITTDDTSSWEGTAPSSHACYPRERGNGLGLDKGLRNPSATGDIVCPFLPHTPFHRNDATRIYSLKWRCLLDLH